MSLEDPVSALQALNASDERQRSPVSRYVKQFLAIVKLFTPTGTEFSLGGIAFASEWLASREEQNRAELVNVIAEELKHRGAQIEHLVATNDDHRRFIEDDMPGLVLDALRKAGIVRARERIARLARILVHAAEVGPKQNADYAEEMLRIAMELGERDVFVLREAAEAARLLDSSSAKSRFNVANEAWLGISWAALGLSLDEVESIGGKLQSFGLFAHSANLAAQNSFIVLQKAVDFLAYIRCTAGTPEAEGY